MSDDATAEDRARGRARALTDLVWHVGAFLIINAFMWLLDLMGPGGIDWAFWVTIPWAFGLAFHVLTYLVEGRGLEDRKTRQYLEEERRRSG